MDSEVELTFGRAKDEFFLAEKDMKLSIDPEAKSFFGVLPNKTYFHSVISHAYFSIFYSARAYLISKQIKVSPPKEHQKTYDRFKEQVEKGELDKELLKIYENELMKASALLHLFKRARKKRGLFTYNVLSEANIPHAQESISYAREFVSTIGAVLKL